MTRQEIEQEIESLKLLLNFHLEVKVIEDSSELERHINDILDRISELIKERDRLKE
jgi:hypothetical protein